MDTAATALTHLDAWAPAVIGALTGLAVGLAANWTVRRIRTRRETMLRDLELGIAPTHRLVPLWVHGIVGFTVGGVVGAAVLLPWLLLAAARDGLPSTAIVPGLVGDSILVAAAAGPLVAGAVALRRWRTARMEAIRAAGEAFRIRSAAARFQPQEEDW